MKPYTHPLQPAVLNGDLESIKKIYRSDGYISDWLDSLVLKIAIDLENLEIIKYFMSLTRPVFSDKQFALNIAIDAGKLNIVKCFVETFNIDLNSYCGNYLSTAINLNQYSIISYLLEKGADITHINLSTQEKIDLINQLDLDQKLKERLLLELV